MPGAVLGAGGIGYGRDSPVRVPGQRTELIASSPLRSGLGIHEMALCVALVSVDTTTVDLVRRALDGSREAFGALVETHWDRLVRLARSVVGDAEAEDVVQDSLVVAWTRLARLSDPHKFGSWVSRIVFRRCLRTNRWQRGRVSLDAIVEPSRFCDPEVSVSAWQILARLAPRQRAVFHLTAVEGMTDAEIAPVLGITPASVRAHRRQARAGVARIIRGGTS